MQSRALTIRLIRLAMAAALIFPLVLFLFASWSSYRSISALADERLARSLDIQEEEATKDFALVGLIMRRAAELVAGLDADGLRAIQAKHPFLKPMTIPAGSYPGQDAPIASVGSWSFILAAPTLPEDVAYRLARALHRGEADLVRRLPQARETTAANTAAAAPPARADPPGRPPLLTRDRRHPLTTVQMLGPASLVSRSPRAGHVSGSRT